MQDNHEFTQEQLDKALARAMEEGDRIFGEALVKYGDIDAPEMKQLRHELKNVTAAFGHDGARHYLLEGSEEEKAAIIDRMRETAYGKITTAEHNTPQQQFESHVSRVVLQDLGLEQERGR